MSLLEITFLLNLTLCLVTGVVVGLERELRKKPAGIRTQSIVIASTMLYSFLSHQVGFGDPTRIAAQIVTGVGFLGAGIIIQPEKGRIRNVTTAASIWCSAAIGMAIGFGFYFAAVATAVFTVIVSRMPKASHWFKDSKRSSKD